MGPYLPGDMTPFKEVKSALTEWLEENIDENEKPKVLDLLSRNKYGMFKSDATLVEAERNLASLKYELSAIRKCKSFRIGLAITYVPRKIRTTFRYLKEEGVKSTAKRAVNFVVVRGKKVYGKLARKSKR